MITVLTGDNDFEIARYVQEAEKDFTGTVEKVEGSALQLQSLPDLLLGASLLSDRRLIMIEKLSDNSAVWEALPEYLAKVPEETTLILIEPKPDKRTKTFKVLQKYGDVREYKPWSERGTAAAERWVTAEAVRLGVTLQRGAASLLVQRALVVAEKGALIDQWRLLSSLEKLAPLGDISSAQVKRYIEETPVESVFSLFETALRGDGVRVRRIIQSLEASEDPYRVFGLLSGQVFWLAALAAASPTSGVAKDFAAHPFVLGKLAPYAARLGLPGTRRIVGVIAEADSMLKTSGAQPWLIIERALIKAARQV